MALTWTHRTATPYPVLARILTGRDGCAGSAAGLVAVEECDLLNCSLWLAPDTFTTDLMRQFYRNLAAGEVEGESLRNAKLNLMKTFGDKATPFDWAGFTLVGIASRPIETHGP